MQIFGAFLNRFQQIVQYCESSKGWEIPGQFLEIGFRAFSEVKFRSLSFFCRWLKLLQNQYEVDGMM